MSALIVFLPPQAITASTEFEYALSNDSATISDRGSAPAPLLPAGSRAGTELVAVVPVSMLSWHRVELPKGTATNAPRLRAVLEGLLEDQLLDEPEALHFALQPNARGAGPLWVATCDRLWLRSALDALESSGRPATRVVPEFAPQGEPTLFVLGDAESPVLVLAGAGGVTSLPLSSQALTLLPLVTAETPCISEPAVAQAAEQVLQRRPELRHPAERWLRSAQTDWDLAQFEFANTGRTRAFKRFSTAGADLLLAPQWKPARWGAALLVALNLVALNAWAWRERSALADKHEAITRTLTQTFPTVKVVIDAPVQMQRELAALRQATGASSGNDMESMLGALTGAAPPQRVVGGLEYTNGELRVRGMALGSDESAAVTGNLKAQGFNGALQGDVLLITAGGAR